MDFGKTVAWLLFAALVAVFAPAQAYGTPEAQQAPSVQAAAPAYGTSARP